MPVMARFFASPLLKNGSYDVAEVGVDNVARHHLSVTHDRSASRKDAEDAARLLAMACNLNGGMFRAMAILRAELIRQKRWDQVLAGSDDDDRRT